MPRYPDLENKTVVLTGGAQGIGAAMVNAFLNQGAQVHFCDRVRVTPAPHSFFTQLELAREPQIVRWIKQIQQKAGVIHVLINNAAIDPRIPLPDLSRPKLEQLMAINLHAMIATVRECAPNMPPGKSSIINFSSITFHTGPERMAAYVASKGAILALSRSLARELGPQRIRVNTLSPGWIMTERQLREYADASAKKLIRRSQCIPDLLRPEDIAEVALFLASEASRAITGQEILADRGWAHS